MRNRYHLSLAVLGLVLALPLAGGCNWNARTANAQGVALYRQAQYQSAMTSFQEALVNDPTNPHIYYNLGQTHHQLAKLEADPAKQLEQLNNAERNYNLCLDRDDDHRECYRSLAVLLMEWPDDGKTGGQNGRTEQAFNLLEGWARRKPTSADPRVELARLYEEHDQRDLAKEKLLEAIAIEPRNPRALAALGRVHELNGETALAAANYSRSLQYDTQQPGVAARRAALRAAGATAGPTPTPAGTRTVTTPSGQPLR
jgi:Flp pilus assembly protein TadD